jgi:hypothetical protein
MSTSVIRVFPAISTLSPELLQMLVHSTEIEAYHTMLHTARYEGRRLNIECRLDGTATVVVDAKCGEGASLLTTGRAESYRRRVGSRLFVASTLFVMRSFFRISNYVCGGEVTTTG